MSEFATETAVLLPVGDTSSVAAETEALKKTHHDAVTTAPRARANLTQVGGARVRTASSGFLGRRSTYTLETGGSIEYQEGSPC